MHRFAVITQTVQGDGSVRIDRTIDTLDAVIDHASQHWSKALSEWIGGLGGLRATLACKGVGDCYDGPDYCLAGQPAWDRIVYLGRLDWTLEAAASAPSIRVNASGCCVNG